jgi:hypothetical protein
MKSFMDEDWTGLTHRQIYSQIIAELEEQQCKEKGHQWVPAFYCQTCGLEASEALQAFKKETITTTMRRTKERKKGR